MPRMNGIEATALIKMSRREAIIIGLCGVEEPHHKAAIPSSDRR